MSYPVSYGVVVLTFAFLDSAISNIGPFLAPILRGIHERTGLHSVIILGGPMPKYGGDLRTIQ